MEPETILCFGDSNTWGRDPHSTQRLPFDTRWTTVLEHEVGARRRVIVEGLNGRTTVWDDPIEEHRCGKTYLAPCLLSHAPLDAVVLMLGTNDLKKRFSVSAFDIGRSIGLLLGMIRRSETGRGGGPPQVLLVCPPPVARLTAFAEMFEGAKEKSRLLPRYCREHADLHDAWFLDAGEVIKSSDADGVHFDPEAHRKLGFAIAEIVTKMLAKP